VVADFDMGDLPGAPAFNKPDFSSISFLDPLRRGNKQSKTVRRSVLDLRLKLTRGAQGSNHDVAGLASLNRSACSVSPFCLVNDARNRRLEPRSRAHYVRRFRNKEELLAIDACGEKEPRTRSRIDILGTDPNSVMGNTFSDRTLGHNATIEAPPKLNLI
jgi:hypothetical protein